MRRVFVVIGASQTKKSATIRALTGAAHCRVLMVRLNDNENANIFVQVMSLQEAHISPEEFIQTINATENRPDVLVALRLRALRGNSDAFPDAFGYIERFEQEGWDIAAIVLLGPALQESSNRLSEISQEFFAIPDSKEPPANWIAHQIRERWGWQ